MRFRTPFRKKNECRNRKLLFNVEKVDVSGDDSYSAKTFTKHSSIQRVKVKRGIFSTCMCIICTFKDFTYNDSLNIHNFKLIYQQTSVPCSLMPIQPTPNMRMHPEQIQTPTHPQTRVWFDHNLLESSWHCYSL